MMLVRVICVQCGQRYNVTPEESERSRCHPQGMYSAWPLRPEMPGAIMLPAVPSESHQMMPSEPTSIERT